MGRDISAYIIKNRGESDDFIEEEYEKFCNEESSSIFVFDSELYIGSNNDFMEVFSMALGVEMDVMSNGGIFIKRFENKILILEVED